MRLIPQELAPRLLAGTLKLTLVVVCVVSLALFTNSAIIVDRFLEDSVALRGETLKAEFEERSQQAVASLEREVDSLVRDGRLGDLQSSLEESRVEFGHALALQVFDGDGMLIAAAGPVGPDQRLKPIDADIVWQATRLRIDRSIILGGQTYGALRAAFTLTGLNQQLEAYREHQLSVRAEWESDATRWVLATSLILALACGALSWLSARRIVRPVEAIKEEAENLRQGNYGTPLRIDREDELGALARAFDDMRDQLRQTTISRNYMDNLLSSMKDALIVSGEDGVITHCNAAATRLTGFTETELLGMPVGNLVHPDDRELLLAPRQRNAPSEARFVTAGGHEVPVSWSASTIHADDAMLSGYIYSVQNIAERKRSEERIRYLARIDPMTKVPNRMQFQHLLQRALAHARRSGRAIALYYLDLDQFKDINDTFGHLAGDTTLEVLAQALKRGLPDGTVVGRLSGDEFAAFLEDVPLDDQIRGTLAR
ncbi:MAG: diguanylate cyclase, partial [Pseudomonadota bacterium]